MMDRNTLLAFFLIALVLILTPYYLETVSPPSPALPEEPENTEPFTGSDDSAYLEENVDSENGKINKNDEIYRQSKMRIGSAQEKTIPVETDLFTALVSSSGGGFIRSFEFKGFYDENSQIFHT